VRVLILSQYYDPEPVPKAGELADELRDRGHDVEVITGFPNYPTGDLYDGTKLKGPADLRAALLKHKDAVLLSFTENLMTYAMGRRVDYADMPAISAIIRDAARNDYRMSSFIFGVVNSAPFRMNKVAGQDPLTTDGGASDASAKGSRRER